MSRIGKMPIKIEDGVKVDITEGKVTFTGAMGENSVNIPSYINVKEIDGNLEITPADKSGEDEKIVNSMHGTIRSLVYNAMLGAKDGFSKTLEIVGVGYRVKPAGTGISLTLGWNHPVEIEAPENIKFEVPNETTIVVKGKDKQFVGQVAARIRELRKPEPYKGKGIRYQGEYVRKKSPKAAASEK